MTRPKGVLNARHPTICGVRVIRPRRALTAENSSGWQKKGSAPYPPMEIPVMARPSVPGGRYLLM
jgi:hypothetical protein